MPDPDGVAVHRAARSAGGRHVVDRLLDAVGGVPRAPGEDDGGRQRGRHDEDGGASDDGTEYGQLSTTLPEGWGAVWPVLERTELVACARQVSATPGQVCEGYSDENSGQTWTVQTHAVVYEYTVRVARTAEELARTTFEVPAGACPMFSVYMDGSPQPQPYFPDAGSGAVELFVRPFVTGS